jgi:hypothetical protein
LEKMQLKDEALAILLRVTLSDWFLAAAPPAIAKQARQALARLQGEQPEAEEGEAQTPEYFTEVGERARVRAMIALRAGRRDEGIEAARESVQLHARAEALLVDATAPVVPAPPAAVCMRLNNAAAASRLLSDLEPQTDGLHMKNVPLYRLSTPAHTRTCGAHKTTHTLTTWQCLRWYLEAVAIAASSPAMPVRSCLCVCLYLCLCAYFSACLFACLCASFSACRFACLSAV